jgi:mRNA interferase YafQ
VLTPAPSRKYLADVKRAQKQGKNLDLLVWVVNQLCLELTLPQKYRVHKLKGEYAGLSELHIQDDWLLIYRRMDGDKLELMRTGSHATLFGR